VDYEHGRLGALMQALESAFPGVPADRTDGLKLLLKDGEWIHVRASNTEPLLRLAAEARTEEAVNWIYERVLRLFQ
jgi:phosphomannomutase